MNLTQEQYDAVFTHDCNLIVTAGAGSGKTRVLVERLIALLDANPNWPLPSVVAITFTEKAAREMRDRVRERIETRIQESAETNDGAALKRWLEHHFALNGARIGTIHSLCAQLLRANAVEAALDPGFEVLDENEAAILLDDAVDQALAWLAQRDQPAAALLAAYGVRRVRGVLRQYASRGAAESVRQDLAGSPDHLLARWRDAWLEALREIMAQVRADWELRELLDWVSPDALPPDDKLADVWRLVFYHADSLFDSSPEQFAVSVQALATEIKVNVGSAAHWGGAERLSEAKTVLKTIRERAQAIQDALLPWSDQESEAAAWLMRWRDAIRLAAEAYTRLKQERAALDFDDLEALTRELLLRHDAVAARYVDEFCHILVDEFQDTNEAQRDILYRLAGVRQTEDRSRLFVVGDPKQSIYAFRGANVSVFGAVRSDLRTHGGRELPLATSFRAHDRLVGAFNDLFGRILQAGSGPAGRYEVGMGRPMMAHRPSEPDRLVLHDQPLTVIALQKPDKETFPGRSFDSDEMRRWEAWTLAQHLHDMVRQGVLIWDANLGHGDPAVDYVPDFVKDAGRGAYRPVGYGDMALLFQATTQFPLYEDVFKAAELPYVTVAGQGYFDRQEVWDLLSLLRALHNPADDLALAVALRSPLFGLSDDALYALRLARSADGGLLALWEALMSDTVPLFPPEEEAARQFAGATLRDLRDLAGRATIAELLTRALDQTGYQAVLTGLAGGVRRRGNVEKLLALARESGRVSLGAFNAYARELTAREVREGEAAVEVEGAVTLMSVHKSKGLEFPVVALVDTSWTRTRREPCFTLDPDAGAACTLPSTDPGEEQPDLFAWRWAAMLAERRDRAERRRLLYVGATRAQDALIVSGTLTHCREEAWLRQWLDALGVDAAALPPSDEPYGFQYSWGNCAVWSPQTPPSHEELIPRTPDAAAGWEHPAIRFAQAVEGVLPALPPLLAEIPVDPLAPAGTLTATQVAALGRSRYYRPEEAGRAVFRHSVLHDTPEPIRPLPDGELLDRRLRQIVGDIVHRALRAWTLPRHTDPALLSERLATYAFEKRLTDPVQINRAVEAALDLLRRFEASDLPGELERAGQVYRELPFVYRAGERTTVQGVIDVLYHIPTGKGQWYVLDYKTAPVSEGGAYDNARRYYLQVGVYAAAVEAKTGQVPKVYLYYIHPGKLIHVKESDWRGALARLEEDLHLALNVGGV